MLIAELIRVYNRNFPSRIANSSLLNWGATLGRTWAYLNQVLSTGHFVNDNRGDYCLSSLSTARMRKPTPKRYFFAAAFPKIDFSLFLCKAEQVRYIYNIQNEITFFLFLNTLLLVKRSFEYDWAWQCSVIFIIFRRSQFSARGGAFQRKYSRVM